MRAECGRCRYSDCQWSRSRAPAVLRTHTHTHQQSRWGSKSFVSLPLMDLLDMAH